MTRTSQSIEMLNKYYIENCLECSKEALSLEVNQLYSFLYLAIWIYMYTFVIEKWIQLYSQIYTKWVGKSWLILNVAFLYIDLLCESRQPWWLYGQVPFQSEPGAGVLCLHCCQHTNAKRKRRNRNRWGTFRKQNHSSWKLD